MGLFGRLPYRKLKQEMITKYGYSEHAAIVTIRDLRHMSRELRRELYLWYHDEMKPAIRIEGVDFEDALLFCNGNPFGAFLQLSYLQTDPIEAKKLLYLKGDRVAIDKETLERAKAIHQYAEPQAQPEDESDIMIE